MTAETPDRLQHLLQDVEDAGAAEKVSVEDILDTVGRRSFGAMLLLPSILIVSPLSGIPGAPTTAALIIVAACAQYLAGRNRMWLPRWILRLRLPRRRLRRAVDTVAPVARWMDYLVRPRLIRLINPVTVSFVAVVCALLAATMPPLELLPLTSSITGFIIALFAMAILVQDGLLVLLALAATLAAVPSFIVFVGPKLLHIIS